MTIYVDVLLAVDLYINYFLVRGTAKFLHKVISPRRCILAAAVGAIFSIAVLAPELPFVISCLIKLASGAAVVLTAFGKSRAGDLVIALLSFMLISFIYAGLMLAIWVFAAPFGMFYRNGVAYFDVPLIYVALVTICAYAFIRLIRYYSDKRNLAAAEMLITIARNGTAVTLVGKADTGNGLCDPFSGKPVIICSKDSISSLIPENVSNYLSGKTDLINGIRLVPCDTIAGHALVPIFDADVTINGSGAEAAVGVTVRPLGADCIFNPKIISL
ncbi:MAG: hypothetical protein E7478_02710 [Ruminococcaceae bacterium]|nr:hypothetical protein [Oscillospiraceae bacterium]